MCIRDRSGGGSCIRQYLQDICRCGKRILGQYGKSLAEISHFADISGPGILRDQAGSFFGKPCQAAAGALMLIGDQLTQKKERILLPVSQRREVQLLSLIHI